MGSDALDIVAGLVFLILVVAAGFYLAGIRSIQDLKRWRAASARQRVSGMEVLLTPEEVLDGITESMTRSGYGVESRTANTATFARSAQMNPALGCLLALLFLLPALVYMLVVAGRTNRVTVAAYPQGSGSRVVIGGDSRTEVARLRQHVMALGQNM